MTNKETVLCVALSVAIAALVLAPTYADAVTSCRVRVGTKTGLIEVSARGVSGPLTWGDRPGGPYGNTFFNAAACVVGDTATKCTVGAAGTPESMIPPDLCTFYLKDAGAECAAFIKGCTPGPRPTSQAKADALKELVNAIEFHHSIPTVVFSGVNVQITSGAGATGATPNGAGNLIIGYNASPGFQTGSHNLVIGDGHAFTSYAGLVTGVSNSIGSEAAVAIGGANNLNLGYRGVIVGGNDNEVRVGAGSSVVLGGQSNTIFGNSGIAVIAGGASNRVDTNGYSFAAVFGGASNEAAAAFAAVFGGDSNNARGIGSVALGGSLITSFGDYGTVAGGRYNGAFGEYSTVCGGETNEVHGFASAVTGGAGNTASGDRSTITGGLLLTAPGSFEWHAPQSPGFPTGTQY